MINNVTTKYGTSFAGVAAYVLHNKRTEAEIERQKNQPGIDTRGQRSDRVAWTETRNLATKDPATAARVMSYYAMERERLKAAAGVKSTGRKAKGPVCHISFSWHPEQSGEITAEQMQDFARGALKVLGFENQQAIIVCHNDEPQPHIHLIISRVDPETGKMVNAFYDQRKLSRYADKYVKSLGKNYCPNREINEKFREEQRRKRRKVKASLRDESPPRNIHELQQAAVNDNGAKGQLLQRQRQAAARIFAYRDALRRRQESQWTALEQGRREEVERLNAQKDLAIRQTVQGLARGYRRDLQELKKRHRKESEQFAVDERRALGRVRNTFRIDLRTLLQQYDIERKKSGRGLMQAIFKVMGDAGLRLQAIKSRQAAEERALYRRLDDAEKEAVRKIEREAGELVMGCRRRYLADRETLIERHDREDARLGQRWDRHTRRHEAQWGKIKVKAAKNWAPGDLVNEMAAEMKRAAELRRGRGR